ncbi:class II aldolase/adducin family protein [Naasia sp. SYSU D00057]|uniref:class II aldolase/adducin family protein n=1 Tax=Naasia sp. SYSU D00057 TaxID=2817380 RepID=UPI0027DD2D5B|nr:class II aldolase/adducin family protein [Naasia sp. SYSU D00057]
MSAGQLIRAARHLAARGLSPGSSGNLSVRAGNRVLITPTGSSLSRVEAGDLAEVSLEGAVLAGTPSKEFPLHLAVYRQRPEATAVVHLHSPYATAIACLPPDADGHAALPPLTPYRVMRLGDVPVAPYAAPGTAELAAGVEALAGRAAVLLLAQHGCVVAAAGIDAAVDLAEELETAAQLTLLLDGRPARMIPADRIAGLRPSG